MKNTISLRGGISRRGNLLILISLLLALGLALGFSLNWAFGQEEINWDANHLAAYTEFENITGVNFGDPNTGVDFEAMGNYCMSSPDVCLAITEKYGIDKSDEQQRQELRPIIDEYGDKIALCQSSSCLISVAEEVVADVSTSKDKDLIAVAGDLGLTKEYVQVQEQLATAVGQVVNTQGSNLTPEELQHFVQQTLEQSGASDVALQAVNEHFGRVGEHYNQSFQRFAGGFVSPGPQFGGTENVRGFGDEGGFFEGGDFGGGGQYGFDQEQFEKGNEAFEKAMIEMKASGDFSEAQLSGMEAAHNKMNAIMGSDLSNEEKMKAAQEIGQKYNFEGMMGGHEGGWNGGGGGIDEGSVVPGIMPMPVVGGDDYDVKHTGGDFSNYNMTDDQKSMYDTWQAGGGEMPKWEEHGGVWDSSMMGDHSGAWDSGGSWSDTSQWNTDSGHWQDYSSGYTDPSTGQTWTQSDGGWSSGGGTYYPTGGSYEGGGGTYTMPSEGTYTMPSGGGEYHPPASLLDIFLGLIGYVKL